ncbi:uncharacterized protein LOC143914292 [Arctopsyche grandis]|uniref:uncharacterized protein LOC143914292 n=1 Tax=Arctopsyche grandis TaxID=121162 RepID=UPI00406D6A61
MEIMSNLPVDAQKSSCGSNCCGSNHNSCIRKYFITDITTYKPKVIPKIFESQKPLIKKEVIDIDIDCQIIDCDIDTDQKKVESVNTDHLNTVTDSNSMKSINKRKNNPCTSEKIEQNGLGNNKKVDVQKNANKKQKVSEKDNNNIENDEVQIIQFDEKYNDPGSWPNSLTELEVDYIVDKGPIRPSISSYPKNERNESFCETVYLRRVRGKLIDIDWLIYSMLKNSVFCFYCKLFSNDEGDEFGTVGFENWRYVRSKVRSHERSKLHINCCLLWIERSMKVKMAKPKVDQNVIEIS